MHHVDRQLLTKRFSRPCGAEGLSESCLLAQVDNQVRSVAEHSRITALRSRAGCCGWGQTRCVAVAYVELWRSRGPSNLVAAT